MSRLLVLGNAGLDISLPVPRLPLAGETLVSGRRRSAPGGKGLNQAVVAARTGLLPVAFRAPLGDDAEAAVIAERLTAEAFAALELPRHTGPSDLSILLVSPDAENCIVTAGARAAALPVEDAARFGATCQPGEWLLLQGNLSEASTAAALRAARGQVMLNTAPLLWDAAPMLPYCTMVVANAIEARQITGEDGPAAAAALLAAGAALAIVTLGAAGCIVAGSDGVHRHAAPLVDAVDSSGAGDTFCGVLAAMLASGSDVASAVAVAQQAAALTVGRHGAFTALPSAAELRSIPGLRRPA
jgi:ribokinase